jgi:hypothetical protein
LAKAFLPEFLGAEFLQTMTVARPTLRVAEPDPFGEVTLAPAEATGRSEAELASEMADALMQIKPQAGAETLRHLHFFFPESPLTVRVAALAALMRR